MRRLLDLWRVKGAPVNQPVPQWIRQNAFMTMRREMRHVVYVPKRDGDRAAWMADWKARGYDLMPLGIEEPDPTDGMVGPAFELQGPLH